MSPDFSIDVQVAARRVRYSESKRRATVRLEFDNADNWWLWPDTLNWWERTSVDARSTFEVIKEPMTDAERALILQRIMLDLREKHAMWANIAGQTDEPRPAHWGPPPMQIIAGDPELAFMDQYAPTDDGSSGDAPPSTHFTGSAEDAVRLLGDIDAAIARIQPMAEAEWEQAQSILRQLQWCRGVVRGEPVEIPPGPLSMGLIATREFDMYGSQPDLASLISSIQDAMNARA